MSWKNDLARLGLTEALYIRKENKIKLYEPMCPYDLAEKLGIRVFFDAMPSMEGAYINDEPPRIILSTLRPAGRKSYNCAHEIGHHVFNHGSRIDELFENPNKIQKNRDEFLADVFAGFLLMPKLAVSYGFSQRRWLSNDFTPEQAFIVSGWLGVGYTTLINHICYSLRLISSNRVKELCRVPPKKIKRNLFGRDIEENVLLVDRYWTGRPIDIQVGDLIIFQENVILDEKMFNPMSVFSEKREFRGLHPGIGRFYNNDESWSAFVRVSRKEYTGQARFRHLEDPEHESTS
jgi:Zn-dependent peptidase ImmA (M78 family)